MDSPAEHTSGTPAAAPGEHWAYRARHQDPLVEVVIERLGSSKPARVLVRFVDDLFEGKQEWVPPARLKVPWARVEAFQTREAQWADVSASSPIGEGAEYWAIATVFDKLIDDELATCDYRSPGVTSVHDIAGLSAFLDVPFEDWPQDPSSFHDGDALVVPAVVSEFIARTAASRDLEPLLRDVQEDQAQVARCMTHGKTYPASRGRPEWHISADRYADAPSEPYHQPRWDLLRQWCGADAVERHDELVALRREVARIGQLALRSVGLLRAAGRTREASEIERELGIPLSELRR